MTTPPKAAHVRSGAKPVPEPATPAKRPRKAAVPSMGEWLTMQTTNSDRMRRDAAVHVVGRWDARWLDFAKVLRILGREESVHLLGAQALAGDYASFFNITPSAQFKSSGAVGSLIPLDMVRCIELNRNGNQCTRPGVPGNDRCWQHGGTWITQEELDRVSAHVSERLMTATDRAVRVLEDLMDDARSELVRLQAALAVLDRSGIGPSSRIELDVTNSSEEAAREVRRRIDELASSAAVAAERIANAPSS